MASGPKVLLVHVVSETLRGRPLSASTVVTTDWVVTGSCSGDKLRKYLPEGHWSDG